MTMQSRFARRKAEKEASLQRAELLAEAIIKKNKIVEIDYVKLNTVYNDTDSQSQSHLTSKTNIVIDTEAAADNHKATRVSESDSEERQQQPFPWHTLPKAASPLSDLCVLKKPGRSLRKLQQLESLLGNYILPIVDRIWEEKIANSNTNSTNTVTVNRKLRCVDLCCGSGHVGILLACLRPEKVEVVCVDQCEGKVQMGNRRIAEIGREIERMKRKSLKGESLSEDNLDSDDPTIPECYDCNDHTSNPDLPCRFQAASLENFHEPFDIALSLHSCGLLTDSILLDLCVKRALTSKSSDETSDSDLSAFILVPCCYGQVAGSARENSYYLKKFGLDQETLPRSKNTIRNIVQEHYDELERLRLIEDEKERVKQEEEEKIWLEELERQREKKLRMQEIVVNQAGESESNNPTSLLTLSPSSTESTNYSNDNSESETESPKISIKTGSNKSEKSAIKPPKNYSNYLKGKGKGKGFKPKDDDPLFTLFSNLVTCSDQDVAGEKSDLDGTWSFQETERFKRLKKCMIATDIDRIRRFGEKVNSSDSESSWNFRIGSLTPMSCTPKNNVVIGVRRRGSQY